MRFSEMVCFGVSRFLRSCVSVFAFLCLSCSVLFARVALLVIKLHVQNILLEW